jgi:hypothetical protein
MSDEDSNYFGPGRWLAQALELEKDLERNRKPGTRARIDNPEPIVNAFCDCGAKFDKDYPNIHSTWCRAYWG